MNLLDRIDPHLTSDDEVVRGFAFNAVSTFPSTKPEWTVRLLKEILKDPEDTSKYNRVLEHMSFTGEEIPLLAKAIKDADGVNALNLRRVAEGLPLEVKIEHRETLHSIFSIEEWAFFTWLYETSRDELEQMLAELLTEMEEFEYYNQQLFNRAKAMAEKQVKAGWVDLENLRHTIKVKKEQPYFDDAGIIAVYQAGLLKDERMIEVIAPLLLHDEEDILLGELKDALVGFQSDRVVQTVEPLVTGSAPIYQIDVIGETHTAGAVEALKRLYQTVDDIDMKSVIIRGLAEQLAADGRPEIEDFMTYDHHGQIFDMDEMAYGYFKVMGYDHPDLGKWKENALRKIERYNERLIPDMSSLISPVPKPATSKKIGRNEPCPCGSGKKYKKCHGK